MANVKISELNSLSKKAYNDVVPIVDTSANETKKILIQDLINNNVNLIAVDSVAPEECIEGDKYFNTTDNLIYTATDTDTWSSTGESPIEGIFYIVFEEQTTYAYNGTTLISVGGGAGSGGGDNEPIGKVVPMVLETAPDGYILCDGSTYTKAAYPDLYKALVGTQFIIDTNSFNVPNIKGKVIVGKDSNDTDFDTIGKIFGSKELQAHTHNYNIKTNSGSGDNGQYLLVANNTGSVFSGAGGAINNAGTGNSGNVQPSIVLNYFIKAQKLSGDVVLSESLPVGTEVEFDGTSADIPVGWEECVEKTKTPTFTKSNNNVTVSETNFTIDVNEDAGYFKFYGNFTAIASAWEGECVLTFSNTGLPTISQAVTYTHVNIWYKNEGSIVSRPLTYNTDGTLTLTIPGFGNSTVIRAILLNEKLDIKN